MCSKKLNTFTRAFKLGCFSRCICFASLHAHVILIIRETKSCIDIDGSCMLMNLQSRREGVQNDKMISVVPQY